MRWSEGFIAVDWGTTNRRAYVVDGDGRQGPEMEDGKGVLSVPHGCFPEAVAEVRARLGDRPLLMAGMIGSNRGWREAPYVPCPAGIQDLASNLVHLRDERAAIVPGVCWDDGEASDIMRGEEVQILGAVAAGLIPEDAVVCHPGTHNKWIKLEGGRITAFRTVMTGELFNLLREHSILADLLSMPTTTGAAFKEGVAHGLGVNDLTAELFSIRARVLLDKMRRKDAASYGSGLLIGNDLRVGLESFGATEIVAIGSPELTRLFVAALETANRRATELDGEQAFLAGARHIAEALA